MADCKAGAGKINNGDWVKSRLHEADEVVVTEVISNLEFIIDNKVGQKNQTFRDMILGKKK